MLFRSPAQYDVSLLRSLLFENNTRDLFRICLIFAICVIFFLIMAYRIDQTPDIHLDEILYYHVAYNLATQAEFSWNMRPVLVHPPVQFLSQALFLHLIGLTDEFLPFYGTYTVRLVNAFAGAFTLAILFRLIERLSGLRAALLASMIFILDPFVVRINRRNMLETMAEMWVVIGFYVFWRERNRLTNAKMMLIGAIFGVALLTKELMVFGMAVIPLFIILTGRWHDIKKTLLMCGVAVFIWTLFPFWAWTVDHGPKFLDNKTFNLRRLIGLVQVTGWNRPGVSFMGALQVNLEQYGSSYILIIIGAIVTLILFFTWRNERGRFVLAWSGMIYGFSVYIILAGTLNEFFFYYLMLPIVTTLSTMTIRYWDLWKGESKAEPEEEKAGVLVLTRLDELPKWISVVAQAIDRRLVMIADFVKRVGQRIAHNRPIANGLLLFIILFGLSIQSFNLYRWVKLFALEEDKVLYELVQYVRENLPPDAQLNSMFGAGDVMLPYMLPEYEFVALRDPNAIDERNVVYTMLSSKNLWGAYGDITPEYYDWVETHGELLFRTYGNTFWEVTLYRIPLGKEGSLEVLQGLEAAEEELLELLNGE